MLRCDCTRIYTGISGLQTTIIHFSSLFWQQNENLFAMRPIDVGIKSISSDTNKPVLPFTPNARYVRIPQVYPDKLEVRRYSESTISVYTHFFREYMRYFYNRPLDSIKKEEIQTYLLHLIKTRNISASVVSIVLCRVSR